jgi:hypothetical protein
MFASILQNQNHTPHITPKNPPKETGNQPSEAYFRCGDKGHWVKSWPNPCPPTRPCPQYGLEDGLSTGETAFSLHTASNS